MTARQMRVPRRAFMVALLGGVASCSSPNPNLYTLEPPPGLVRRGGAWVIELRGIGLARYLERSQIVRSSENFRLDVLPNDWWGEPLDAMIGRVLDTYAMSQRLPGSTVYAENGAISADPDTTLQVNIQRLDQDASGAVRLVAQFAVVRKTSDTRGVTLDRVFDARSHNAGPYRGYE